MSEERPSRRTDATPEQLARIEAIRQAGRSPEARARQAEIRREFQDKPDREELMRRGSIDPSRATTLAGLIVLHKTLAELRRIRESRAISLTELSARSGISLASLSRLEGGKNANFTFETLARYAAALGLHLEISVRENEAESPATEAVSLPADVGDLLARTHRHLGELLDAIGSSHR